MRKFKYDLDRKALETIYISFIRPVLEYADVIWDICDDDEFRFNDASTHEGHLRQNG